MNDQKLYYHGTFPRADNGDNNNTYANDEMNGVVTITIQIIQTTKPFLFSKRNLSETIWRMVVGKYGYWSYLAIVQPHD